MLCFTVLFGTTVYAQDPAQYGTPFTGVPNRMDANIYQLNFRSYTSAKTIAAAKNNLQRLKDLGINVVYTMPFTTVTTDATKGADKSPYSIKDLKGVDPGLGTLQDIRDFVAQAHTLGMAVIFDFVPNQTAWDHPWITQHNDWYAKNPDGTIRSPDAGAPGSPFLFLDVAEINLNNTAARAAIIDAARYWIFAANFDGIRIDWADKAGQSFNSAFVSSMRSITTHNLLLLAEGSNEGSTSGCNTCGDNQPGAHWSQGYDFIYGTNFYWNIMKKIWVSGEPATNLNGVTTGEYTGAGSTQLVARLMTSHDNYNEDGSPFSFMPGRNAVMSAFAVAAFHRGVPFIYNGIEVGNTSALPYPWRDQSINWTQDLTVYTEMQKMLNVRNSLVALRRGQPTSYTTSTNNNVIAFSKIDGANKVVVMVNVRNGSQTFTIPAGMAGSYTNPFNNNAAVTLTSGQNVTLNAYQYLVYSNANVPVVAVTSVAVSPTSASVKAGLKVQLTASITPSNATNQAVTWTSSNTAVATVDANGLVSGVAAGSATITVRTADGNKTATSAITVTPASTFTVHFYKPSAWATPVKIYWWSALPAGVLADGAWPGVDMAAEGTTGWYQYTFTNVSSTNIIFNGNGSDVNKTADLNRAGTNGWYYNGAWYNSQPATIAVTSVSVSPTSATVAVGATSQLTATVNPSNATNKTVTWTSSNNGVASVNASGLVTAVGGGTATITVTTQDGNKTATCAITVPTPPATYYYIRNRWQNTYLYDAGANVGYSTGNSGQNYKWSKVNTDGGFFLIRNLGTGHYMHIEPNDGTVRAEPGNVTWYSQQWAQEDVDATWKRFRSRWNPSGVTLKINVESQTGFAQDGIIQDGWFSAHWQLITVAAREGAEEDATVEIYPNPATGNEFTVGGADAGSSVTVSDVNGKVVLKSGAGKVSHSLSAGLYFVTVQSGGVSVTKKLVVE